MAKPVTVITWNTGAANRVTPSAGEQIAGYAINAVPTSGNFNWFMFWIGEWLTWLNSLFGSDGTYTPASGAHIVLAAGGTFKHGLRTLSLHPSLGNAENSSLAWSLMGSGVNGVNLTWQVPIPLEAGKRVIAVRWRVKDNATGPTKIYVAGGAGTDGGSATAFMGAPVLSAGTGATQTITLAPSVVGGDVLVAGTSYSITFSPDTTIPLDNLQAYVLQIDYDQP